MNNKTMDKKYVCDPKINYMVCELGNVIKLVVLNDELVLPYCFGYESKNKNISNSRVIKLRDYCEHSNIIA